MKSLVFFEVLEISKRGVFVYRDKYNILDIDWESGYSKKKSDI